MPNLVSDVKIKKNIQHDGLQITSFTPSMSVCYMYSVGPLHLSQLQLPTLIYNEDV